MSAERKQFERWSRWAGVPDGVTYPKADRMVSEAVTRLEAERDELARERDDLLDALHRLNVNWDEAARLCGDPKCAGECRHVETVWHYLSVWRRAQGG